MARELPVIRYSLKERGRVFGIPRDTINVKDIVDKINGPECQERVACRDVQGYLGHWTRIKFGLRPSTGGVADGKLHYITPDLVTTYLKAYPDGTIEHRTELLDTTGGIAASKMWDNKVGGFSSAIDLNTNAFYGFDYVPDPNFIKNSYRGVALDAASLSAEDIELEAANELNHAMLLLVNQKDYALDQARYALENALAENEALLDLLAQDKPSDTPPGPLAVALDCAHRLQQDIDSFARVPILPQFKNSQSQPSQTQRDYERLLQQYGSKR